METDKAVMGFAQGDKIKAGIIWISQVVEQAGGLDYAEQRGAELIIQSLLNMLAHEIHLAARLAPHPAWQEAGKSLDLAVVMAKSGVIQEAGFHLTQALSKVTTIAQQAMVVLQDQKLI